MNPKTIKEWEENAELKVLEKKYAKTPRAELYKLILQLTDALQEATGELREYYDAREVIERASAELNELGYDELSAELDAAFDL